MIDLILKNPLIVPDSNPNTWSVGYDLVNLGDQRTGNFRTQVYWSQDEILDRSDRLLKQHRTRLAANESKAFSHRIDELTNPRGVDFSNGYLIIRTDSNNRLTESDKLNNTKSLKLTPTPLNLPDLTVTSLSAPARIVQGSFTRISYGRSSAGFPFIGPEIKIYLSKDTLFDSKDDLLGGVNWPASTLGINISRPKGKYKLLAVVDPLNQYQEANERNNVKWMDFEII